MSSRKILYDEAFEVEFQVSNTLTVPPSQPEVGFRPVGMEGAGAELALGPELGAALGLGDAEGDGLGEALGLGDGEGARLGFGVGI